MTTLSGVFNTDRMVREYAERMYFPATREAIRMQADGWALARSLAEEAERLEQGWAETRIGEVKIDAPYDLVLGQPVYLSVEVYLGRVQPGDVIVIENSGAYGLTSSPTRFISHPEPREALLEDGKLRDVSESLLNHWRLADN